MRDIRKMIEDLDIRIQREQDEIVQHIMHDCGLDVCTHVSDDLAMLTETKRGLVELEHCRKGEFMREMR